MTGRFLQNVDNFQPWIKWHWCLNYRRKSLKLLWIASWNLPKFAEVCSQGPLPEVPSGFAYSRLHPRSQARDLRCGGQRRRPPALRRGEYLQIGAQQCHGIRQWKLFQGTRWSTPLEVWQVQLLPAGRREVGQRSWGVAESWRSSWLWDGREMYVQVCKVYQVRPRRVWHESGEGRESKTFRCFHCFLCDPPADGGLQVTSSSTFLSTPGSSCWAVGGGDHVGRHLKDHEWWAKDLPQGGAERLQGIRWWSHTCDLPPLWLQICSSVVER